MNRRIEDSPRLFNPEGDDSLEKRKIVGGETTNLLYVADSKYIWAREIANLMITNFWSPNKANLSAEITHYEGLDSKTKRSFDCIISFLTFLDSLQTHNLPNIAEYITAPEVKLALSYQLGQEALHTISYSLILDTLLSPEKRREVSYLWRESSLLMRRNKFIADIYQSFHDGEKSRKELFRVLLANYILEGIYFYNGFAFFYKLAEKNLMSKVVDQIKYINRDELTHVLLFTFIIKAFTDENGWMIEKEEIYSMFKEAVEHEIEWSKFVFRDSILGITEDKITAFTKYLCDLRLKEIGLDPLFKENENPYSTLLSIGDTGNKGEVKANFFETSVTSYNMHTSLEGWDKF